MDNDKVTKALNERFLLQKEYLGDAKPVNLIQPLVSVTVATYQHANYIKECLDGILMQEVTFPYEIILGEDGSADGTQEICKEYAEKYPDKIRLFIRDRKLSQYTGEDGKVTRFNGIWNRMSARGKYIAWCEGDDYWIDPLKLQKQVDFLEKNNEFGMVFSKVYTRHGGASIEENEMGDDKVSFEQILCNNPVVTLTVCMRKSLSDEYCQDLDYCKNEIHNKKWMMGDYPMWIYIAHKAKIYCMPEVTGIYRILQESASHSKNIYKEIAFIKSRMDISCFYARRYGKEKLISEINYVGLKQIIYKLLKSKKIAEIKKEINTFEPVGYKLFLLKCLAKSRLGRKLLCKKWNI